MAQFQEFMRRLQVLPLHVRTHVTYPADQLEVEVGIAAEVVVDARAPFQQPRQDLVQVVDGIGIVHPVVVHRAVLTGARAVPAFPFGVTLAAEQDGLAMLAARHQHQHRCPAWGSRSGTRTESWRYG